MIVEAPVDGSNARCARVAGHREETAQIERVHTKCIMPV